MSFHDFADIMIFRFRFTSIWKINFFSGKCKMDRNKSDNSLSSFGKSKAKFINIFRDWKNCSAISCNN